MEEKRWVYIYGRNELSNCRGVDIPLDPRLLAVIVLREGGSSEFSTGGLLDVSVSDVSVRVMLGVL
jgi:hypothetical protein